MIALRLELTDQGFTQIQELVQQLCGIYLPEPKKYLIENRLGDIAIANACDSFSSLCYKARVDTSGEIRKKIVEAITTHETLWFRDTKPFDILSNAILTSDHVATCIQQGRRVRIWSAACSTGQEPYSIAIAIMEHLRKNPQLPNILFEIVATDISGPIIDRARAGEYDDLAISRGLAPGLRERYFEHTGKIWKIRDEVKKNITFRRHNLLDSYTALRRFDIVFCRNVLIYFEDETKKRVLNKILSSLLPNGFFVAGSVESVLYHCEDFRMVESPFGIYYRAGSRGEGA